MAYDSISDFLLAHGFTCLEDSGGSYFYRLGLRIPASVLAGHTVASFTKQFGLDQERKWPEVKITAVYRNGEIVQGKELEEALKELEAETLRPLVADFASFRFRVVLQAVVVL
jgi:hypothetical protein